MQTPSLYTRSSKTPQHAAIRLRASSSHASSGAGETKPKKYVATSTTTHRVMRSSMLAAAAVTAAAARLQQQQQHACGRSSSGRSARRTRQQQQQQQRGESVNGLRAGTRTRGSHGGNAALHASPAATRNSPCPFAAAHRARIGSSSAARHSRSTRAHPQA